MFAALYKAIFFCQSIKTKLFPFSFLLYKYNSFIPKNKTMLAIISVNESENRIKFKNDAIPAQKLGNIVYSNLTNLGGNDYSLDFSGYNVERNAVNETGVEVVILGTVNPTKVFWAIAAILKEVVCPECV